ncbi:hypothetical protein [Phocaeicola plebeius]|uniref:hypothetical protein n=1 Tax=Phocaeicola plebeius TaxID=310297 RepID=UPI0026F3430B|nr:hypothetical protein [Phocaeicola plebeius]
MKKNIFLWVAVFAVGAMSSCSVDKVVDQAEARYIGFDPFANKVTRGLTNVQFGHDNFDVWGKYEDVEVFAGKTVSWQTSSWTYQPLVPWVDGKTYEFAAIAPHVEDASYDYENNQYTLGDITVNATPATQIDYMTATPKPSVGSGANPVSFDFNHILSKIDFKFQPKITAPNAWPSPVKIDIKKITLADVNTVNTYTANNWGTSETSGIFEKGNGSDIYGTTTYDGADVTALQNQFSWLVVPQTDIEASNRALTIKFDVYTQDAAGAYNVKVLTNKVATVEIATDWVANTVYTYTVYIGSDVLGQDAYITFDVNSANWGNTSSNNDLNVPTN